MSGAALTQRLSGLLFLLFTAAAGAQTADPYPFVSRSEEELLLLELSLDGFVLADAIPAYQADGDLLLPLGELARVLSLAIAARPEEGTAEGFVVEESRRFHLDVGRGEVIVGETRYPIRPGTVEVHRDDIYAASRAISEWLPLSFEANFFTQSLSVTAREPLPIQARRERLSQRLSGGEFDPSRSPWPPAPQPYSLFGVPAVEAILAVNAADGRDDASSATSTLYSVRAVGELGYQEFETWVSGSNGDAEVGRFTIGRRDPTSRLLGPLGASEVLAGTVWNSGSDLLFASDFGEGILVSNYPILQQSRFDSRTFIGVLDPGWDVELYRNGVLFGVRRPRADGRYEFENVPLLYGLNSFRFVFYGPQGQRREETQRINVGEGLVPAGETWYRAVALDSDRGGRNALVELDHGLSQRFSVSGAAAWSDESGSGTGIVKGGVSTFFSAFAVNALAGVDSAGGAAGQLSIHGRLRSAGFLLQHAVLHDYAGRLADATLPDVEQRTLARLDGGWSLRRFALPWSAEIARNVLPSGASSWQVRARTGTVWRRSALSIDTDGTRRGDDEDLRTRVLFSQRFGNRWTSRAGIQMRYLPDSELESGDLILERRTAAGRYLHVAARHQVATDSNLFTAGIGQSQGTFGATALASWDERSGWALAANLNVSVQWDERRREPLVSSRSFASYGAASILVFVDENGNGQFDTGELPVEGVDFFVNRVSRHEPTDRDGVTRIGLLAVHRELELTVSEPSIPDPFLAPVRGGIRLTPRPGRVEMISFPLVASGELVGTVLLSEAGAGRGYGGIRAQVVAADGSVAAEAISSFDGYFEIVSLPPGRYQLRIAPDQARLLRLGGRPASVEIRRGETSEANLTIEKE